MLALLAGKPKLALLAGKPKLALLAGKPKLALLAGALGVVVVLGGGAAVELWATASRNAPAAIEIGGPFTLTAPDGRTISSADFRGKWMLVYFGYTNCPDACPMALNSLANALDMLHRKRREIAPVFITVDPERDTRAVIGHYTELFDKQIIGLTGTEQQIAKVEGEYRVYAARHTSADGSYTMDHSSIFYLMDKHGRFNSVINAAATPDVIAADLAKLD